MYEAYYGFKEKPFSMLPDPSFLYLSKKHQTALTLLEYGLFNQVGFCVVSGEPGAGKTTILRAMLERVGDNVTVGLITNTHQSFGGLLDWILSVYDLHKPDLTHVEMHQVFMDYLIQEYANNRTVLLIVDEAQNMNEDSLEELRMLSNVNSEKDQLLQVVLVGQPGLKDMLRKPELMQFAQRIAVDYHLDPLDLDEVCGYIQHRLVVAGATKDVFTPAACERIFNYSGGTPRLINLLCETALVFGFADQVEVIDVALVEEMVKERMKDSVVPFVNKDKVWDDTAEAKKKLEDNFPWISKKDASNGGSSSTLDVQPLENKQSDKSQKNDDTETFIKDNNNQAAKDTRSESNEIQNQISKSDKKQEGVLAKKPVDSHKSTNQKQQQSEKKTTAEIEEQRKDKKVESIKAKHDSPSHAAKKQAVSRSAPELSLSEDDDYSRITGVSLNSEVQSDKEKEKGGILKGLKYGAITQVIIVLLIILVLLFTNRAPEILGFINKDEVVFEAGDNKKENDITPDLDERVTTKKQYDSNDEKNLGDNLPKKEALEKERLAKEKLEREKLEQERLNQEQLKQERLKKEQIKKEKEAKAEAEKKALAKKREAQKKAEEEKKRLALKKEQQEAEAKAKAEAEAKEKEKRAAEELAEKKRIQAEAEARRVEQKRIAAERKAAEKQAAEQEAAAVRQAQKNEEKQIKDAQAGNQADGNKTANLDDSDDGWIVEKAESKEQKLTGCEGPAARFKSFCR